MKFLAVVTLCGLYQGHVDACLEQKERTAMATRAECIARGQEMLKTAKTAAWYGGIKEPHQVKLRCLERR